MKLIRYGSRGHERPGIEIDGIRFDCSKFFKDWDREFFQNEGLANLESAINSGTLNQVRNIERVAPPIARPGSIICVGLNYSDHVLETGMEMPTEPVLFMKPSNTINGPYDKIVIPEGAVKVDWEVELGIVINHDIYNLENEEDAKSAIAGYTIVNDVSERAFQLERGGQWIKGKSSPGFTPVGPYIVTKDEIEDVLSLNMKLMLNQEIMQEGNTNTMIFKPEFILKYISKFMKLEAGDLVLTGTPPGVGLGMSPQRYIVKGDVIELEIEGLGKQTQMFV